MATSQSIKAKQKADELRNNFGGPMSEGERAFLRDMAGFIRFAIENGLSFSLAMSVLGHDVNEILRNGGDLTQAKAQHWHPKVSGYADLTEDAVGEPDELD